MVKIKKKKASNTTAGRQIASPIKKGSKLKKINKKRKRLILRGISKHKKVLKNPSISHFNIKSHFIYDLDEVNDFFKNTKNKNLLKVNEKEMKVLEDLIEDIDMSKESDNNTVFITIKSEIFNILRNYTNVNEINEPLSLFIKQKFEDKEKRDLLSCRKLTNLYFEETGNRTNRTTINNLIRKKYGYHYLKTVVKNKKILSENNKLISFAFIKIITKCLLLGFDIIYIDETTINNKNNNYRCFRKADEQIYFNFDNSAKLNLIMAINKNNVVYYEINKETTTQESFLNFMKNFVENIKLKKIEEYVVVMDNLSCHKTESLIKFYKDNNINIVFNSPYVSEWNSIELAFRAIKRKYYKKIFASEEEIKKYVLGIINSQDFLKTLYFNYGETLKEYKKFIILNKETNLNCFDN